MTGHTKEPWVVGPVDDTVVTHVGADGARYEVASVDGDYNQPDEWPTMEANARRIVDSVNALAGIPDPLAFVQAARVLHRALEGVIDATASYLPPDGISQGDCINRVLTASDNIDVFHALRAFRAATGEA